MTEHGQHPCPQYDDNYPYEDADEYGGYYDEDGYYYGTSEYYDENAALQQKYNGESAGGREGPSTSDSK